jgi:hypothetical protein
MLSVTASGVGIGVVVGVVVVVVVVVVFVVVVGVVVSWVVVSTSSRQEVEFTRPLVDEPTGHGVHSVPPLKSLVVLT